MSQQMIVDRTPVIPVFIIRPVYDAENNEWSQRGPTGILIFGKSKDEVAAKLAFAIRLYNTNCPHCGYHTSARTCPDCGLDREYFPSESGGMQAEHIRNGQA